MPSVNLYLRLFFFFFFLLVLSTIAFAQGPLKQYSGGNNGSVKSPAYEICSDTMRIQHLQSATLKEALKIYEFSFLVSENFGTAGILLQGGGVLKMAKLYKVYLAIQNGPFVVFKAA